MTIDEHLERETLPNYFALVVSRAGESVELRNPLLQGRNTIMEQLHANVRHATTGALVNRTTVVHGAPGAGKSELTLQSMHQLQERRDEQLVVVHGTGSALRSTPICIKELMRVLPPSERRTTALSRLKGELRRMQAISAFRFGSARREGRHQELVKSLDDHLIWLGDCLAKLPSNVKDHLFVFCVDEFQNPDDAKSSLRASLHCFPLGSQSRADAFRLRKLARCP